MCEDCKDPVNEDKKAALAAARASANKDHLRLWVAALRSGEYKQTIGALEGMQIPPTRTNPWYKPEPLPLDENPRHCCMGVACHVAMKNGVELNYEPARLPTGDQVAPWTGTFDGEESLMPAPVTKWLGMTWSDVPLEFNNEIWYAAHLNDGELLSFVEIAFLIEQTYELDGPAWNRKNYGQY